MVCCKIEAEVIIWVHLLWILWNLKCTDDFSCCDILSDQTSGVLPFEHVLLVPIVIFDDGLDALIFGILHPATGSIFNITNITSRMIDDLLISLWFDISASFAHATDADDVSNENLGATKGEFLSFATFFWFEDQKGFSRV